MPLKLNSSKSVVVAGTLAKLVQYLASEELPGTFLIYLPSLLTKFSDTNYIKMFILTFHRFMTSVDLLNHLIAKYQKRGEGGGMRMYTFD
jgi:RasGEF N-terminal motif